MRKWCQANSMSDVNNDDPFEFRSGEVDCGSYVMSGATPAVHLNRPGTVRMLENIQQAVPEVILSNSIHMELLMWME